MQIDAAVRFENDLGRAALQFQMVATLVDEHLAHVDVAALSDVNLLRFAHSELVHFADRCGAFLAHVQAVVAAHRDALVLAYLLALVHAHEGVHDQADVEAVGQTDIAHARDADGVEIGDAGGFDLELLGGDVPVATDLVGLGAADGLVAVDADADLFVQTHVFGAVVTNRDVLVVIDTLLAVLVNRDGLVQIDLFGAPAMHVDLFVAVNDLCSVSVNGVELVPVDGLAAVVADPFVLVVFNLGELIFLGVQPKLLRTFLVFKAQGVGIARAVLHARTACSAQARMGLDARLRLVVRKVPRRHLHRVVDTAGDDGIVRVAVQKVDDHFLPDAGNVHRAVIASRPGLAHANPTAGVLIVLAVAVPVKLDLHAAIFVGIDFFARRTGDDCGLWTRSVRLGRSALAAVVGGLGDGGEADAVRRRAVATAATGSASAT